MTFPILPVGSDIVSSFLIGAVPPVLFRSRFMGPFFADVTLEEQATDELAVTQHPVEQGAAITDHSYKYPSRLTIRAGWSNSSPYNSNPNRVEMIYNALLALQATRQPFDVMTGKRFYRNMLFQSLAQTTDAATENSLMLTAELTEIILVSTQILTVPDATSMKTPEVNAPTVNTGTKALDPVDVGGSGGPDTVLRVTITKPFSSRFDTPATP